MIDKNTYLNLKREIRYLSYNNLLELCDSMKLDTEERQMLIDFYQKKKAIHTCMELGISQNTYTNHMKIIFTKIYNYKNTLK